MSTVARPSVVAPSFASVRRHAGSMLLAVVPPAALLLLWFGVTVSGLASPLLVASPAAAFRRLYELFATGAILSDIGASFIRWGVGYAIGCAVGVPVGLLLGSAPRAYDSTYPLLDFLRSLPVTALFPLFLLMFGIGDSSKIAMAFAATVFVVILNSAYGVLQAKPTRTRAAKVFGASRAQVFRWVTVYEALPQTMVGMRTALSLALIVVIVSEMFIGTQHGLGQRVFDAYTVNSIDELYAVLLLTGFLGYVMNRAFVAIERHVVFWAGQ